MDLLGDTGHVESHFNPFGAAVLSVQYGCTVCAKHTIDTEIVLDVLDGTPR
jgi:hypothetical protein